MGMKGWDPGQLCLCYELICKISLLPPAYVPAVGQRYPGCAPRAAVSRGFCAWVSSKGEVKKLKLKQWYCHFAFEPRLYTGILAKMQIKQ